MALPESGAVDLNNPDDLRHALKVNAKHLGKAAHSKHVDALVASGDELHKRLKAHTKAEPEDATILDDWVKAKAKKKA